MMSEESHIDILKQGAKNWNEWRQANPSLRPLLRMADLEGVDLRSYELMFRVGDFPGADFRSAKLAGASAYSVDGSYADLSDADLTGATFQHVDLQNTRLNGTIVEGATFSECRVFGMAAWGLKGRPAKQSGLLVSPITAELRPPTGRDMAQRTEQYESALTVDSLELAPLFFSLVERERFADLVNMLTSKVVLILGRFIEPRMAALQAVRAQLADQGYLPVVFDFAVPWHRDLTETVSTLAHMSRFVVADLTDPKSIPQELSRIVPFLPSVPVVPIIESSDIAPYAMFEHLTRYPWVLELVKYADVRDLLSQIGSRVVKPAESFCEAGRR